MVLDDALDFAVVPAFEEHHRSEIAPLCATENVDFRATRRVHTLAPLRLAECRPFKIVVPRPDNIRRRNLETYFQAHGVEIAKILEMDDDRHARICRPFRLGDDRPVSFQ